MPTTIHVPDRLLERVDSRAKALGVSRSRFIVGAVEEALGTEETWAPELVRMLESPIATRASRELEDSMALVVERRANRRKAIRL